MDLEYKDFVLNGYKLFKGYNILRKFRNQLPFGIMIDCELEPALIDDFESERVKMYLLDKSEVEQIEQGYIQSKK
jgi:hypothetical protein